MCRTCVDSVEKYFPGVSVKEMNDLLWNATAYPCVEGEHVAKQLAELRDQIDALKDRPGFYPRFDASGLPWSDVEIAMGIADADMSMCMKNPVKQQGK